MILRKFKLLSVRETALQLGLKEATVEMQLSLGNPGSAPTSPRTRTSWRIPRLAFSSTPLRDVVALMHQHNARTVILGDTTVG